MKQTITLILLLAAALLSAPEAFAQGPGLDIRYGANRYITRHAGIPVGPSAVTLSFHKGAGAVAAAADIPSGKGPLGLHARAGFHAGGKHIAFSPFAAVRCAWTDSAGNICAGYGATLSFRLLGPVGAYCETYWLHPVYAWKDGMAFERRHEAILSVGVQVSI